MRDAVAGCPLVEAHAGEHVHFPGGVRVEIDARIVGDVGEVDDGVERREIDLVDLPEVHRADRQTRIRRQATAEPLRVQHGDGVAGAGQHRLRQLGADVSAPAGNQDVHTAP